MQGVHLSTAACVVCMGIINKLCINNTVKVVPNVHKRKAIIKIKKQTNTEIVLIVNLIWLVHTCSASTKYINRGLLFLKL